MSNALGHVHKGFGVVRPYLHGPVDLPEFLYLLAHRRRALSGRHPLVTMVFNVPKNNALASVAPADPRMLAYGLPLKVDGLEPVRAAAALAAATPLTIALCY